MGYYIGTPRKNGRVERNVARALRFQGHLPKRFWGECVLDACHLINRTPTPIINNKSSYEILFAKSSSYENIHVFGCLYYAHNQRTKGNKFESHSRKYVLLGYPFGKIGWQLFGVETWEYFVSRDVKFHEKIFSFAEKLNEVLQISREAVHEFVSDEGYDCWSVSTPTSGGADVGSRFGLGDTSAARVESVGRGSAQGTRVVVAGDSQSEVRVACEVQ